jgi:hypothetical protein
MNEMYVVKNQHGLFASKHKEWLDGREPKLLFKCQHKDEAINMVFELSSKDINVRAEAIIVEIDANKHPVVEVTAPPPVADTDAPDQEDMLAEEPASAEDSEDTAEADNSETTEEPAI